MSIAVHRKDRELKEAKSELADVLKYAYVVVYVEGMLRSEKEDIPFLDALHSELAERDLLNKAKDYLEYARFRAGLGPRKTEPTP